MSNQNLPSIPDELLELAMEYVQRRAKNDTLHHPTQKLYTEMVGSYGNIQTDMAIEQMGNVFHALTGESQPTLIKWYAGTILRNPGILKVLDTS